LVDSLLEGDIRLTLEQASHLLSDVTKRRRIKRKLADPASKRWKLPIPYTFDGSHSQFELTLSLSLSLFLSLSLSWGAVIVRTTLATVMSEHSVLWSPDELRWAHVILPRCTHRLTITFQILQSLPFPRSLSSILSVTRTKLIKLGYTAEMLAKMPNTIANLVSLIYIVTNHKRNKH